MYRIIGADGQQYGPIIVDDLRRWIIEGRANAQTQVLPEGSPEWKALGTLPEFASSFAYQQSGFTQPGGPPRITPVSNSHGRQTNSYALWGMILGILSVLCCVCCCLNIPLGGLGLTFSLIGLSQVNENSDMYEGRGLAIAGIVLSALGLLIGVALMLSSAANGNYHPYYHSNWHYQR